MIYQAGVFLIGTLGAGGASIAIFHPLSGVSVDPFFLEQEEGEAICNEIKRLIHCTGTERRPLFGARTPRQHMPSHFIPSFYC